MSLALAAFFVSFEAFAQGMVLPGKFAVSESGGATYEVPITVPPGTAGMVPSMSLSYNSQAGNGLLGMGWQLEGLPSLGRCPRTMATDGVRGGSVNYDANDRFCLDGQRLIAISGTYGADGTEYRAEIESFSKVVSRGTAGTGPAWFEVRTKTGQIMEFGNSTDSRILAQGKTSARSWAVNKVSDTKGNFYTVTYVNDATNGEVYPSRIDYTGNTAAGLAPYNSVRFIYATDRPDKTTGYHAGSMYKSTVRLSKIQTYAGSSVVADYRLAYGSGTYNGRSQLASVTLCDGAGSCLPATTTAWFTGGNSTLGKQAISGAASQIENGHIVVASGDFNGDGLTDFYTALISEDSGRIYGSDYGPNYVFLARTDGTFTKQAISGAASQIENAHLVVALGDFNGDGLTDFYTALVSGTSKRIYGSTYGANYLFTSNGDGTFTKQAVSGAGVQIENGHMIVASGDFNGDGLSDFYTAATNEGGLIYGAGTGPNYLFTANGNGTFTKQAITGAGVQIENAHMVVASGDFNGDGLTDFYTAIASETTKRIFGSDYGANYLFTAKGDGTFAKQAITGASVQIDHAHMIVASGDFNGDGLSDFYTALANESGLIYGSASGPNYLFTSKGDGTFVKQTISGAGVQIENAHMTVALGDFNSDGLTDFYTALVSGTSKRIYGPTYGANYLFTAKTDGTFAKQAVSGAGVQIENGHMIVASGDFNGDGLSDFYTAFTNEAGRIYGADQGANYKFQTQSDGAPQLVSRIADGVGSTTAVVYKSMVDASVYTKDKGQSAGTYPVLDLQMPLFLTSRTDQDDGIGGQRSIGYAYAGAKSLLDGRGFLGFRQFKATDLQLGTVQTTTNRQDYPFIGLVAAETKTMNSLTLSSTANSYAATGLGGTRRAVTLTQSQVTGADLNGTVLPSVTSTYQYDAYGNATQITVTSSDGYSKTTANTYTNDTANWLLGRLATASVTSTAPATGSQAPAEDTTPTPFDFTDVTNAALSTAYEASATVSGFNRPLSVSVSGGNAQVRKNGTGNWGSTAAVVPGDTLNVRMTSSGAFSTAQTATIIIGTASIDWKITTLAVDTTPNSFDFADVSNATISTAYEASAAISGINTSVTATVSGGGAQIRKNGAGSWATSVSIVSGDTLNIRMTSSGAYSTAVTAVATVGTVSANWIITTGLAPCAGVRVGGYCWYLGSAGQSCTTVCATHGGYHSATKTYAGSAGTLANCASVLTGLLGVTASPTDSSCSAVQTGCMLHTDGPTYRCLTETTEDASFVRNRRACACNN